MEQARINEIREYYQAIKREGGCVDLAHVFEPLDEIESQAKEMNELRFDFVALKAEIAKLKDQ